MTTTPNISVTDLEGNSIEALLDMAKAAYDVPQDEDDDLSRAHDATWEKLDEDLLAHHFGGKIRIEEDTIDMGDWVFVVFCDDTEVAFINYDVFGEL